MFKALGIILATTCLLLPIRQAHGCPHCNERNWMAPSVMTSKNVLIVKAVEKTEEGKAKLEVLKTLRGDFKRGDTVDAWLSWPPEKKFIWCDAREVRAIDNPFSVFSAEPEVEAEVRFLLRLNPEDVQWHHAPYRPTLDDLAPFKEACEKQGVVKDLGEALDLVQGISNTSKAFGMAYVSLHREKASTRLIENIEVVRRRLLSGKETRREVHQLRALAEMLTLNPDNRDRAYVLAQIKEFENHPWEDVKWLEEETYRLRPTTRGLLLEALLKNAPTDFKREMGRKLLAASANVKGEGLADGIYALYHGEILAPEEKPYFIKTPSQGDHFALGLYYTAKEHASWWEWATAFLYSEPALAHVRDPVLKRIVTELNTRALANRSMNAEPEKPKSLIAVDQPPTGG